MTDLFVIDTSVLISAHLSPFTPPRQAYDLAHHRGMVVFPKPPSTNLQARLHVKSLNDTTLLKIG